MEMLSKALTHYHQKIIINLVWLFYPFFHLMDLIFKKLSQKAVLLNLICSLVAKLKM